MDGAHVNHATKHDHARPEIRTVTATYTDTPNALPHRKTVDLLHDQIAISERIATIGRVIDQWEDLTRADADILTRLVQALERRLETVENEITRRFRNAR